MAVVEVGWNIRAGYIGDTKCTRQLPSINCNEVPKELNFPSILTAAEISNNDNTIQPLWTLESIEKDINYNIDYLSYIIKNELGCSEDEPLMLIIPEVWHENFDLIKKLFHNILESNITSALYCCRPSVAWTLASGKTSAVVLDVGHNHSTCAGVLDGYTLRGSITSSNIAGNIVTQNLMNMIGNEELQKLECVKRYSKPYIKNLALFHIVNIIKRMTCFVSNGKKFNQISNNEPMILRAPDGNSITIPLESRTKPFESLFSNLNDIGNSLPDLIVECKRYLDPEWQQQALPHILSGGTSKTSGFCERILKEVQKKDSCYFRYEKEGSFHVPCGEEGAWSGASLMADSSSFTSLWVTLADLEEEGNSVLHRKLLY